MGKDLHYLIEKFFRERMDEHAKVRSYTEIQDENAVLYEVVRIAGLSSLVVHLSDAYLYTLHDYYSRPKSIKSGDFILVARPEADYHIDLRYLAARDKIGIGKIGTLLGALNRKNVWQYKPKE